MRFARAGAPPRCRPHHRRPARPPLARGRGHRSTGGGHGRDGRHPDRRRALRLPRSGAGGGGARLDGRKRSAGHSRALRDRRSGPATSIRRFRRRSRAGSTSRGSGSCAARSSSRGRSPGAFTAAGGVLARDEVVRLETRAGCPPRVRCRNGSYEADKVVIAAGAWSPGLAAPPGIRILVVPERGYHAMLPRAGVELKTAVHYGDRLISMTPMTGGLRVSSGAELADVDTAPDWKRRDIVIEGARALFPDLDDSGATRWMGPRPSTPDSLPVTWRASGASRRPVRYRARHPGTHPLGNHGGDRRRPRPRGGSPISTSRRTVRIVSESRVPHDHRGVPVGSSENAGALKPRGSAKRSRPSSGPTTRRSRTFPRGRAANRPGTRASSRYG